MHFHNQSQGTQEGRRNGCGSHQHRGGFWKQMAAMHSGHHVPVNIKEADTHYEISVFAPAREKANFSVTIKDKDLHIVYTAPTAEGQESQWSKQEYYAGSFSRQFLLNDKIDETSVTAQYLEGVLHITLAKTAAAQAPAQDIHIV